MQHGWHFTIINPSYRKLSVCEPMAQSNRLCYKRLYEQPITLLTPLSGDLGNLQTRLKSGSRLGYLLPSNGWGPLQKRQSGIGVPSYREYIIAIDGQCSWGARPGGRSYRRGVFLHRYGEVRNLAYQFLIHVFPNKAFRVSLAHTNAKQTDD